MLASFFLRLRRRSVLCARKPWKSKFSITPLSFDAYSPGNPREYPRKPYIATNYSHCTISRPPNHGSIFIQIFAVGSENACILKQSAKWPFKVIQGHSFRGYVFYCQWIYVVWQSFEKIGTDTAEKVCLEIKKADKFITSLIVAKLQKPGFRAPNTPTQKRI